MNIDGQRKRSIAKIALVFFFVAWAAIWALQNKKRLVLAFEFHLESFLLLILLAIISFLGIGLTNQIFITHLGARLKFLQWASLSFASSLANLIFPMRAGAFMRARYLNKKFILPYSDFISTQAAFITLTVLINCLAGLFSLIWLYAIGITAPKSLGLIFAIIGIGVMALILLPTSTTTHESSLLNHVRRIHNGWNQLLTDKELLRQTFLLTAALTFISVLRLYIAFRSIGHPMIPAGCLLAASLAGIGTILSLTPSGLGIKEAAIVFIGVSLELPTEVVVLAAVMDRAVGIVVLMTLGSAGSLYILHDSRQDTPI